MKKYGKRPLTTVVALVLAIVASLLIPYSVQVYAHAASSHGSTELVSVASDGTLPNNSSGVTKISPDGRYVYFWSYASNLVPNDTNGAPDIFLRDRLLGTTTMLDVNSSGQEANQGAGPLGLDVSDDGHYLVYSSSSTNLVPQDYYNGAEIYVRDLQTGTTSVIFRNSFTGQSATAPVISGDGNWIAFVTYLPFPYGNDQGSNVYLINRSTLALTHISNAVNGSAAGGYTPSINYDGRRIAFYSDSANLVSSDTNGVADIFLWDRGTNSISRVSVNSAGAQANNYSEWPQISGDGSRIVYLSYATNLTPNGTMPNQFKDYFYDVGTGATTLVDVTPTGQEGNAGPNQPYISEDGNFVVFSSSASDLVSGDTNDAPDVFVRDLQKNTTFLVSYDPNGNQFAPYGAGGPEVLNADGRFVAFKGNVPLAEVFLHDTNPLPSAPTNLAASSPTQTPVLNWSTVAGATSYNVYRDGTNIGSTLTSTFTDSTALEGQRSYSVTAVNGSGESAQSNSVSVVVDKTPPVIAYSVAPTPNLAGWNNGDVTATFTCGDNAGGSGILSCPSPVTVDNEGIGHLVDGMAVDNAGNRTTIHVNASLLVAAVNSGGDSAGNYSADAGFTGGSPYTSTAALDTSTVTVMPAPQSVYQTVRYGTTFAYVFPGLTPNARYTLRLHFNELYWGTALAGGNGGVGSRVFNVAINGQSTLTNFDIFSAAGGANTAIVEELPATADANGNIAVQFTSVTDNAMVNGIELYQGSLPAEPPAPTPPTVTTVRINAGAEGTGNFLADTDFNGGTPYTSTADVDTSATTNPAPEAVYQSARYGNFTYLVSNVTPGATFRVRLHFNELYWGTALAGGNDGVGSRVFNVAINGTQVLNNFDIYATAGGANKAVTEDFTATSDAHGHITIQFTAVTDNAMVNGIEIVGQ